jgi:uncharacterized membrane protein YvlD (DUF360 family)
MSDLNPTPVADDNPKKPFKAIGSALATAILVALSAYFTGHNDISVNGFIAAIGAALVNFLVTYFIKNPTVVSTRRP